MLFLSGMLRMHVCRSGGRKSPVWSFHMSSRMGMFCFIVCALCDGRTMF
jgi:hypothetical protein